MNRCLLVATDGSPAARAALLYALDFAAALRADEIACLSVHEEYRSGELASAAVVTAGEMALATGTPRPILFELPDRQSRLPIQPDAVLDACRDLVTAAGFRFTPIIGTRVPSDVIATTAYIGEVIFLGRNSDPTPSAPRRLGFTASMVLQNVQQTILVCPKVYAPVERLVLLLAADVWDAELVASGATWAGTLNIPALVAAGSDRSFSHKALEVAKHVLTDAGIPTNATIYSCRPEEFAEKLSPTSLLLVARRRRWGVLDFWFGSTTDRIVERAAGPVAVMPKP